MLGLSILTIRDLRNFLMECDELASDLRLRTLFGAKELLIFRSSVPEGNSLSERVDLLIDLLVRSSFSTGENLLIIFLKVLHTRFVETDSRYNQLSELILQVKREFSEGERLPPIKIFLDGEKNLSLLQTCKSNAMRMKDENIESIDPRLVPQDIELAKAEIIDKINHIEKVVGIVISINDRSVQNNAVGFADLINRITTLEVNINQKLDDLRRAQAYIYQHIRAADLELVKKIFDEVHQGRIEQAEIEHAVDATRRAMKYILETGIKMSDPKIVELLGDIYQSVNNSLDFEQQFELTLPVIPFLIDYKLKLGAGVDLDAVWKELISSRKNNMGKR